jgi:hypothetical protein
MNPQMNKLEQLRKDLYELTKLKGLNHPAVVLASQRLDIEINKYYQQSNLLRMKKEMN